MKVSQEFINTDESATNKSDDNDGHGYKWIADTMGNKLSNMNSSKGPAHTGTFQRALKSVLSWAQIMPACLFVPSTITLRKMGVQYWQTCWKYGLS